MMNMIAPRAIYFFYFAALANLAPYSALYYQSLGLSGGQIGILLGIAPIAGLIAAPSWGALADTTRQNKRILLLTIAASAISIFILSFIHTFAWLVLVVAIYAFFITPIIPLVANSVVELLGDRRREYGKQRVWGSYGWGLAGLVSGLLIRRFGLPVIFYAFTILLSFSLIAAARFPVSQRSIGVKVSWKTLGLFTDRRWLLFLCVILVISMGMAMVGNYFMIYLRNLGTPDAWMGVALALATISEIPFLFFSDRLLRRFGMIGLIVMGGGVVGLRALMFSIAAAPWQALALQLVHGLTFALVLVGGVEYASHIAPPGLGATAQGVFSGVFSGLGYAVGSLIGGLLLDSVGVMAMYRWAGTGVLLAVIIFYFATIRVDIRTPEENIP